MHGSILGEVRVRVNADHGFHVLCDRCERPAIATNGGHVWVEWDGDGNPNDDPLVVCGECNNSDGRRTKELDGTLGELLLGLLINAREPFGKAGEYIVAGHTYFGEGDLSAFVGQVSALANVLDESVLG